MTGSAAASRGAAGSLVPYASRLRSGYHPNMRWRRVWVAIGVLFAGSLTACDKEGNETNDGAESSTSNGESGDTGGGSGTTDGHEDCPLDPAEDPDDGWPCVQDSDCAIQADCCNCIVYNPDYGWPPGGCGDTCDQDKCEEWGLGDAVCVDSQCMIEGQSCNQDTVTCDEPSPPCDEGMFPGVWDGCWAGSCLPVSVCDWVPDCSYCNPGDACIVTQGTGCAHHRCLDIPECEDFTCDCLGWMCRSPYDACQPIDGGIMCS